MRSLPTTCVDAGFGEMKLLPSSVDLPVVMLTRLSRLENATSSAAGAGKPGRTPVSLGPMDQSQSPPPALWSGAPMNFALEPLCATRIALHCPPVGPMTNASPALFVRMLGSAAPALPGRRRFGLNAGGVLCFAAAGDAMTPNAATTTAKPTRTARFISFPPST